MPVKPLFLRSAKTLQPERTFCCRDFFYVFLVLLYNKSYLCMMKGESLYTLYT